MLKSLLEERGVRCFIKNERLFTAIGEIPFTECFPELWLLNDDDLSLARQTLEDWQQQDSADLAAWTCPRCAELVDGNLGECWNCGTPHAADH